MSTRPLSAVLAERATRPPRSPTAAGDALRRVYELFPAERDAATSAAVYAGLYAAVLRARSAAAARGGGGDDARRRVMVHQLVQYRRAQIAAAGSGEQRPWDALIDSLLVYAMDPAAPLLEHPVAGVPDIPQPGTLETDLRWSMPLNRESSCFCDVVVAAMFMSGTSYDVLLTGVHLPLWRDAHVRNALIPLQLAWVDALFPSVTDTRCYGVQFDEETEKGAAPEDAARDARSIALRTAEEARALLKDTIVTNMRTLVPDDARRRDSVRRVTDGVTLLRLLIAERCKLFDVDPETGAVRFGTEDAVVFFHAILDVGGWGPAFLPVVRTVRAASFSLVLPGRTRNLLADVPPLVSAEVSSVVRVPVLDIPDDAGGTLQAVFDAAFSGVSEVGIEDAGSTHMQHILTQRPDLADVLIPVLFPLRRPKAITSIWHRLARVPDTFVFALRRGVHSSVLARVERVFTPAEVGDGERLSVPLLDADGRARFVYRIAAMVLERGEHYTLYLRVGGGDQWYFYDDNWAGGYGSR
ncbi:hypothetical protein LCGC14_1822600 [marine sediment metagenome]|uniref:Uncharacterized protein n=1 Tax=marine sediment metagenome TaxID=412755 RepID=A0A0F9H6L5_9ZZZZ